MGVVALVIVMSPAMAIPAYIEGLAVDHVMAATVAPGAGVFGKARVVSPGVVKVVVALLDFVGRHDFSWGVIEYNLRGKPVVGVYLCECDCTVVTVLLEFEKIPVDLGSMVSHAVDFGIEGPVADDLHLQGVVLLQVDGVVDKLGVTLTGVERELLFVGQHGTGVWVSVGMEGTGVGGAAMATSEKELWLQGVKVVLVVRGENFHSVIRNVLGVNGGVIHVVGVVDPARAQVYTRLWSIGGWYACLFSFLIFHLL